MHRLGLVDQDQAPSTKTIPAPSHCYASPTRQGRRHRQCRYRCQPSLCGQTCQVRRYNQTVLQLGPSAYQPVNHDRSVVRASSIRHWYSMDRRPTPATRYFCLRRLPVLGTHCHLCSTKPSMKAMPQTKPVQGYDSHWRYAYQPILHVWPVPYRWGHILAETPAVLASVPAQNYHRLGYHPKSAVLLAHAPQTATTPTWSPKHSQISQLDTNYAYHSPSRIHHKKRNHDVSQAIYTHNVEKISHHVPTTILFIYYYCQALNMTTT